MKMLVHCLNASETWLYSRNIYTMRGVKLTTEQFINRAVAVHGTTYDYSKFVYKAMTSPGIIICRVHGEFLQTPPIHLRGRGCPFCGRIKNIEKQLMPLSIFVEKSLVVHGGKYSYEKSFLQGLKEGVEITCPDHGSFWQRPDNHLMGIGCPKCACIISKPEIAWLDLLGIPNENRHMVIRIGSQKFNVDALIDRTVYEFYGDFWHGNPRKYSANDVNAANNKTFGELYRKTIEREEMLKTHGYTMVCIWEDEFMSP